MTTVEPPCGVCGGAGWLRDGKPQEDGLRLMTQLVECDACGVVARRRQERLSAERQERGERHLAELRQAMGRLADLTFADFDLARKLGEVVWNGEPVSDAKQVKLMRDAFKQARAYADAPRGWLYLYGPPGAGKSHLAAAIASALIARGSPVAYVSVPDLLAFVKRGFDDGSGEARLESLLIVDALIMDDLGAENATAWSAETLFRLIDERAKHERTTIITSNVHYDALQFRIASRIAGQSMLVPLLVSDYRRLR